MPTASESALVPVATRESSVAPDEFRDDLGERMQAMSKCSQADAAQILEMLTDPTPVSDAANAVHEAGLARFAARFRIVE